MARAFCLPGIFFLVAALVLQILVSISLRYVPALDIARTHFSGAASAGSSQAVNELRSKAGILHVAQPVSLTFLLSVPNSSRRLGHGYSLTMSSSGGDEERIGASWTRGLILHPICKSNLLLYSKPGHDRIIQLPQSSSLHWRRASKLDNVIASTKPGPGFWMTLASFIVLLFAGCTVCLGRRHDRRSAAGTGLATTSDAYAANAAEARPWYKRFGRNEYMCYCFLKRLITRPTAVVTIQQVNNSRVIGTWVLE
ncbi:hypothetical protein AG1IA_01714 [Rhizoctonia solani AG-1 IA]|uniref:Uncharacterized protein n=1 Tax=Thanatephorus cucumeris (strain AG1-IA) TaxID=983506 RepID=L8X1Z8_THACA|nr:hypothetical protein AG1IA_01714 [Rhizoctonia solani AG-1 IA]